MFRIRNHLFFAATAFFLFWSLTSLLAQTNSVAIFKFRPTNIEAMSHNAEILYALISAMEKEKSINVMPRREMQESLERSGLVQNDNPAMVLKAGKAVGVGFVLFGNVTRKGGQILTQINLMDVENKRITKTWNQAFSGREDILNKMASFATELSTTIRDKARALPSPSKQQAKPQIDIENLRVESRGKEVAVSWELAPSHPAAGFNVYRSEDLAGPYQFIGRTNEAGFNDANVKKGKTYYYRIGIITDSGKETKGKRTVQTTHIGEDVPYPPVMLSVKGFLQRTEIKFVPCLLNEREKFKITEYKIYRQDEPGGRWVYIASVDRKKRSESGMVYTVEDTNDIEDGTTYAYAISSVDKKQRESSMSEPMSVTTIGPPSLMTEKGGMLGKIKLTWQPLENIKGYYLYRKNELGDWEKIAKISKAEQSEFIDDEDLLIRQQYEYYLTAYDEEEETDRSNVVVAKTKDLPPPPQDLKAESGLVKSVRITWTPVDDPDVGGYAIYRGTDSERLENITKVKGPKSNSFLDKGGIFSSLEDGKDYYYSIASYNLFRAEGELTQPSVATTKPRPSSIKGLTATAEQDNILVRWDTNPESDIKRNIVYRSRNDRSWSKMASLKPGITSYVDRDLKPESDYRYRIIVEDKDGLKSDPAESGSVPSPIVKAE
jgi:fibronectin type 3 domain-containing protein/TolB-like protein